MIIILFSCSSGTWRPTVCTACYAHVRKCGAGPGHKLSHPPCCAPPILLPGCIALSLCVLNFHFLQCGASPFSLSIHNHSFSSFVTVSLVLCTIVVSSPLPCPYPIISLTFSHFSLSLWSLTNTSSSNTMIIPSSLLLSSLRPMFLSPPC